MGFTNIEKAGPDESEVDGSSPGKRKYFCSFTDKPLGFEKHLFNMVWAIIIPHSFGLIGVYEFFTFKYNLPLMAFMFLYVPFAGMGITMGAHRYWTHKCYKAKLPLQIILAFLQTTSGQYPIFKWCRDHRVHHKYVDTDADPHDSRKGFWYSHILWLVTPDSPELKAKWDSIDMSDLDNDPIVRFQAKYYWTILMPLCSIIIPMNIIHYLAPELSLFRIVCANFGWFVCLMHVTFFVNSAAHMWGYRPYDKGIRPRENLIVSMLTGGEGFHNYHHTFPWDYKAAEIGFYRYNWSTMFLDFFAKIGWAYDLKSVPANIVKDRVKRTGDGSNSVNEGRTNPTCTDTEKPVWGWGDNDMSANDYKIAVITKPSEVCGG